MSGEEPFRIVAWLAHQRSHPPFPLPLTCRRSPVSDARSEEMHGDMMFRCVAASMRTLGACCLMHARRGTAKSLARPQAAQNFVDQCAVEIGTNCAGGL